MGGRFHKTISKEIHLLQLSNLGAPLNIRCSVSDAAIVQVAKANIIVMNLWWFYDGSVSFSGSDQKICSGIARVKRMQGEKKSSIIFEVEVSMNFIHFFNHSVLIRFLFTVVALLKKKPSL